MQIIGLINNYAVWWYNNWILKIDKAIKSHYWFDILFIILEIQFNKMINVQLYSYKIEN